MKILVLYVAAEFGGALTILNQYYHEAFDQTENRWFFMIGKPKLQETEHIQVLRFPWVKKSWFHRLFFDAFYCRKIIRKIKPDEIVSLQNIIVPHVNVKQTLYIHQVLPFIDKRYKLIEDPLFWIYQNIIGKKIYRSIRNADKVVVQTKWMKEACLKKVSTDPDKITVNPPVVNIKTDRTFQQEKGPVIFFYPANGMEYKNHRVIVEAVFNLVRKGMDGFKVVFTLDRNKFKHIRALADTVNKEELPVEFIGRITQEEVYGYYSRSVLVFPSYMETFGLPLLEAKIHKSPILASDCPFSHELLEDYTDVRYFDYKDSRQLSDLMAHTIMRMRTVSI